MTRMKITNPRNGQDVDFTAATPFKLTSNTAAANQDATLIKAAPGAIAGIYATNTNAARRYLKLYDKSTAPTSADTPAAIFTLEPGTTSAFEPPAGINFVNGIGFRITTGVADADATAATAGDIAPLTITYS